MEFHPVLAASNNGVTVKGSADAANIACPDSVLHGLHRKRYDSVSSLPSLSTPYTSLSPITPITYHLTPEQIAAFHRDGLLVIPAADVWTADEQRLLVSAVNEMDAWPEAAGRYMKYFEKQRHPVTGERILARVENFTQYHSGLEFLLNGSKLVSLCSQLFGEAAVLYKEKINYKLPGGDGFAPHQDVAAGWWMYGQSFHISTLIAVDEATVENGCLEVVSGQHKRGIIGQPWKEVDAQEAAAMDWQYVRTKPGDVVFFDSFVPHRSGVNTTDRPRRVLYATYAIKSEGDWREQYYADKRLSFPPDVERPEGKKFEYKI
jgi:ectoine hydroxylase-related dioxygenase (phytanoyl-CoA dioxygenase family)